MIDARLVENLGFDALSIYGSLMSQPPIAPLAAAELAMLNPSPCTPSRSPARPTYDLT